MTTTDGANGVRADLDGIRALGELARRQAAHVGNVESYLHDTCTASGAFRGVMTFFQGTYSGVLRAAGDGLSGARRTHEFAAQNFEDSAVTYEAADRGSYDVLARVAGGAGWDIDPYRSPAGDDAKLGFGAGVPAPTEADRKDPSTGKPLGDEVRADAKAAAIKELKGIPERVTRETVVHDGRRIFKDQLEPAEKPDSDWIDRTEGRLKKIADPLGVNKAIGDFKKNSTQGLVEGFHEHAGAVGAYTDAGRFLEEQAPHWAGPGLIENDRAHAHPDELIRNSHEDAQLHHNVREVAGWYDGIPEAKNYVEGLVHDPTGGVGKSVGELKDSVGDAAEVYSAAHEKSDTSALDWSKR
jgi:hypothetical protein